MQTFALPSIMFGLFLNEGNETLSEYSRFYDAVFLSNRNTLLKLYDILKDVQHFEEMHISNRKTANVIHFVLPFLLADMLYLLEMMVIRSSMFHESFY